MCASKYFGGVFAYMEDRNVNVERQVKPISNTKRIVGTAIFSALAFVISLFEFSIFPQVDFLKLDFSNVITLLGGFIYGPISAIFISLVKELLCLTKSGTGGIGELANFIITMSFVLLPTITYRYKKGIKTVILTVIIGSILQVGASLLANRFVLFPLYMGNGATSVFNGVWYFIMLFNIIKTTAISVITILLYKRTSYIIKRF